MPVITLIWAINSVDHFHETVILVFGLPNCNSKVELMLDFENTSSKQHCKVRNCDDKLLTSLLYSNSDSQQRESIHHIILYMPARLRKD